MAFVKIGEVVKDVAQLSGNPEAMEAAYIVESAQKEVEKVLGERAKDCVWAIRYKDGVLTFGVVSSVWAHELKMNERAVIESMHLAIHQIKIKKIKSVIGSHN